MKFLEESIDINGQKLTIQVGKLAQAATTSVLARLGDTCVLVTLTTSSTPSNLDYLPLKVEYAEKLYAGGRIKGSRWVKREGKPSDEAILNARLIDRLIRPFFPKGYRNDIQIIVTMLSVDGVNSPEILSAVGVVTALHLSPVPWNGPIATSRVAYIQANDSGSYVVNPTEVEQKISALDLIVASTADRVVMIETGALELSEQIIIEGIKKAKEENKRIIDFIEGIRGKVGMPKLKADDSPIDSSLEALLKKDHTDELNAIIDGKAEKEFDDGSLVAALVDAVYDAAGEKYEKKDIAAAVDYVTKKMIKSRILTTKKRLDGRGPDEVRKLSSEVGILPRTHGTGLFSRGDTQVLSIVTLGAPSLEQLIETPEGEEAKRYIHHYNMPPYSVGEVGRVGFPSRREIGHGALAEKAIEPVLPSERDFPYTIRVVSEVLSSNGSTSMASTCGSTLALLDAGVPIKAPVSGIAMGLMWESDDNYVILTDIMGIEDFSGDMDFKVAGTRDGVTAVQLDVKNDGLTDDMIVKVFEKAHVARLTILENMIATIDKPRTSLSKFAPKVVVLTPPPDKIGEIIGPGGKNIRSLIARTQTDITVADDGRVTISGIDQAGLDEAVSQIEAITRELEAGEEFDGEVKRLLPFGAFVEVLPGKEGLVHVSKMGKGFVKDPADVVKIGQKVHVRVTEVDRMGRINLELLGE